tara:strand:+ start:3406 stop:3633 length:228 start_codon:yes stop_codon:yes gene_type:complete
MNKRELQRQIYSNNILEFIWHSAKSNPNWNIETAKLLASMHGLDYKEVYKLGRSAKVRSKFVAKDWNINIERMIQ